MTTANTCAGCRNVHSDTRKLSPFRWRCIRAPQPLAGPPELEWVDPLWRPDPPYKLCQTIRRDLAECPEHEPVRSPEL